MKGPRHRSISLILPAPILRRGGFIGPKGKRPAERQQGNAGEKPTLPLDNQFWGERYGKLQDPFGHIWSVSMVVKMSESEREAKRQAAMGMFEKGEHAGFE